MNGKLNIHPKVAASLLGGWITTIILYSLDQWAHVTAPAVVGAALVGVITFGCGYLAPTSTSDAPAAAPPAATP